MKFVTKFLHAHITWTSIEWKCIKKNTVYLRQANVSFYFDTLAITDTVFTKVKVLSNGPFICDQCGLKCSTRPGFRKHYRCHHGGTKMLCDMCPQSFKLKYLVVRHILQVHLKIHRFVCKECNFKAKAREGLTKHMWIHGPKTECPVCHRFVSNLKIHSLNHVTEKCKFCGFFFKKLYILRHVRRAHTNERNILGQHLQKDRSTPLQYKCQICDFKTCYQNCLMRHIMQHGLRTEWSTCHELVHNMKNHLASHVSENCEICGNILKK